MTGIPNESSLEELNITAWVFASVVTPALVAIAFTSVFDLTVKSLLLISPTMASIVLMITAKQLGEYSWFEALAGVCATYPYMLMFMHESCKAEQMIE